MPIILSSDKTQLTELGSKMAYPVYLTIGNIPKGIRRKPSHHGYILLAYLPATKLEHISNKSARRRALANLYHSCMGKITQPLRKAGAQGIETARADGFIHQCHPIIASLSMDYPEQLLGCCVRKGLCPTCPVSRANIGQSTNDCGPRDLKLILEALETADQGQTIYANACSKAGIKPVHKPFWKNLPYTHIFRSVTPDILHQLYQGVIKHLISWLREICGDNELDARFRRLPPNHNVRNFMKGISGLSRLTGKEHGQISHLILGVITGIQLPSGVSSNRLIRAVRGMLDFLFLAQYPLHTTETLEFVSNALKQFHAHKAVFIDLGVRDNFDIPKLHALHHYIMYIELYGTTDNFNTEYSERLHIDYAKDAWKSTNGKDEYPQMTAWLERREKIFQYERFIRQKSHPHQIPPTPTLDIVYQRPLKMTKHPSRKGVTLAQLSSHYGAVDFQDALAQFVAQLQDPQLRGTRLQRAASNIQIPFNTVHVYHRIKFIEVDPYAVGGPRESVVDSIHVQPARKDSRGRPIPARFDTVLINDGTGEDIGVTGSFYLTQSFFPSKIVSLV